MKIMTIMGTRPEIIRLSLIIKKLDVLADAHILVHTGQNYDHQLSEVFLQELGIRKPDYMLNPGSHSFGKQLGNMLSQVEPILFQEKPDRILLLGDTNSALCTILAERMGIPVYHMEAGNRCYDLNVPEEINRKMIDAIASFNLPYTEHSNQNLLREGIPPYRIWVTGNPIGEVVHHFGDSIDKSDILHRLGLRKSKYFLVTTHRAENVDNIERLSIIIEALNDIAKQYRIPVICSIHPRTRERLQQFGFTKINSLIKFHEPFGFFDFVKLEKNALCLLTDSGTVQEEGCILYVPTVTIRQSTERPETVACGSNAVAGLNREHIVNCVSLQVKQKGNHWAIPEGYDDKNVSIKVVNLVLGGQHYV